MDDNNSRFSLFKNNVKNQKNSPKDKSKSKDSSERKNNFENSLKLKIRELMDSSFKSNEKLFGRPKSERSIINLKEKDLDLHDPLNKIGEYSRFFKFVDNSGDFKRSTLPSGKRNNMVIKLKTIDKINAAKRFFSAFSINRKKIMKLRPYSNINENRLPIQGDISSISKNVSNYNSEYERDIKSSKLSKFSFRDNRKKLSRAITPDLSYPIKLKGKLNAEKFLKKMLGTRYKEQYISYEEQKFNKLIKSLDIQKEFLNKSKLRLKLEQEKQKVFIKRKKEYKAYESKLKDINDMLQS